MPVKPQLLLIKPATDILPSLCWYHMISSHPSKLKALLSSNSSLSWAVNSSNTTNLSVVPIILRMTHQSNQMNESFLSQQVGMGCPNEILRKQKQQKQAGQQNVCKGLGNYTAFWRTFQCLMMSIYTNDFSCFHGQNISQTLKIFQEKHSTRF